MAKKKSRSRKRGAEANGAQANERVVARNRRALHQYEILRRYEAGLSLTGSEIKSIRAGRVSIQEAYCRPRNGEMLLIGGHIARYEPSGQANHEPTRDRRLLLHRREIAQMEESFAQKGTDIDTAQAVPDPRDWRSWKSGWVAVGGCTRSAIASRNATPSVRSNAPMKR